MEYTKNYKNKKYLMQLSSNRVMDFSPCHHHLFSEEPAAKGDPLNKDRKVPHKNISSFLKFDSACGIQDLARCHGEEEGWT